MTHPEKQLTPVPFTSVNFTDSFWAPRMEVNRKVTIQHIYQKLVESGRIEAFGLKISRPVPSPIVLIFGDSDPAKWIEAASYSLATHPDPALEAMLDGVVDKVISAQQPDGYLNTQFTAVQPEMRWKNLRDWHEMYCAGHLMEGAVAHFEATGRRNLLDALARYADHIAAEFGPNPGQRRGYCGHPEIELALVRMYHATGNKKYLELSKYFVEERGATPNYYDIEARERGDDPAKFWFKSYEYCQAQVPVREQTKVVGHAVRAVYLLSAVADLAGEYQDASLLDTADRLWDNLVTKRMYLTGGIGPSHQNEGFTTDYDLPDETAYAETCATIGLMMWNHRMLQFAGESRFADTMERGLYNGFLSGVSLEGSHFLYENPLSSAGNRHRVEWFECPCCPPNVARNLASAGKYLYSTGEKDLWVHLYAGNTASIEIGGQTVIVKEETLYPWDGAVKLSFELAQPKSFILHLRVPGWCKSFDLAVNGAAQTIQPDAGGYIAIERDWQSGDSVTYTMAMPVEQIWANPQVRQLEGRVAIQRGPIVYCLEGVDHGNIILDRISVDAQDIPAFKVEYKPDFLGGSTVLTGKGKLIDDSQWGGALYQNQPPAQTDIAITAIPYCVWDNRESGEMRVWLRAG